MLRDEALDGSLWAFRWGSEESQSIPASQIWKVGFLGASQAPGLQELAEAE